MTTALFCGALFGFGLALSGMLDPRNVRGFLDLFGQWDPTLAFVLAGAVGVSAAGVLFARLATAPLCVSTYSLPLKRKIDPALVAGAAVFGVGWGLSGFCPGPALASLPLGVSRSFVFTIAMLAGMMLFRFSRAGAAARPLRLPSPEDRPQSS